MYVRCPSLYGFGEHLVDELDNGGVLGGIRQIHILVRFVIDDLHLGIGSPCIEAGMDAGVYGAEEDFDGVERPQDGDGDEFPWYDMGAFEYVP